MEERRRHKRLDLDVSLKLERLEEGNLTTLKYVHVTISDLSRTGVGFTASQELEIGSFYDTKIQIWTKETIEVVIEIVRSKKLDDMYHYGSKFIGMTETDALKIDIYGMFNVGI